MRAGSDRWVGYHLERDRQRVGECQGAQRTRRVRELHCMGTT